MAINISRNTLLVRRYGLVTPKRLLSASFKSQDLQITPADPTSLREKPLAKDLVFGKYMTDHMLRIRWTLADGWDVPKIVPFQDLKMNPASKVLHYAQELFEGMKAYRGDDDAIRMFRPMHNMNRMVLSATRSCLPEFEPAELADCIRRLIQIDQEWVPHCSSSSLYIRPTMIGLEPTLGIAPSNVAEIFVILSPSSSYFATGAKPVSLLADPNFVRSWPGGCGYAKMGSNYAPTMWINKMAGKYGCQQVLWLFGPDMEITEVGAMNIFALFDRGQGRKELVTPSLANGLILPGITRRSIIELTSEWNEFEVSERKITIHEVLAGAQDGTLLEVFGAGTAAVVSPVASIYFDGEMRQLPVPEGEKALSSRLMKAMTDIYYGRVKHPWAIDIEDWKIDPNEQRRIDEYRESLAKNLALASS